MIYKSLIVYKINNLDATVISSRLVVLRAWKIVLCLKFFEKIIYHHELLAVKSSNNVFLNIVGKSRLEKILFSVYILKW